MPPVIAAHPTGKPLPVAFLFLSSLAWLATPARAAEPTAPEVLGFGSGLRVVLAPTPGATRVATTMAIAAGSLDDPEGREGVAHLVEHLWFDSHEPTGPTAWEELHGLGCEVAADTWPEFTRYGAACPPAATDALLALELRRVHRPLAGVEDAALELARRVIGAEDVARATPNAALHRALLQALYPVDHPLPDRLARPPLVGTLSRHDAETFAGVQYRPEQAVLAITGGFDPAAVRAWLTTKLGEPTVSPPPRVPTRAPPRFRRALRVAPRALPTALPYPAVSVAWSLPPGGVGFFERALLAEIVSRVLWWRFRHDARVVDLGCWDDATVLATPLVCFVGLADDASPEAVAADARAAVDGLWESGSARLVREVFPAARSQALVQVRAEAAAFEPAGGVSDTLALSVLLGGDGAALEQAASTVRAASVDELLAIGREHLGPDRALVVAWQPTPTPRPAVLPGADPGAPPREAAPIPAAAPTAASVAERTLPTGLRVLAVQRPGLPLLYAAARVAWRDDPTDGARELLAEHADGAVPAALLRDVVPWGGRVADGELEGVFGDAADPSTVLDRLRTRLEKRRLRLDAREPWLARDRTRAARARAHASWWAHALPTAALDPSGEARARVALLHLDAIAEAAEEPPEELGRALSAFRPERTTIVLVGPAPVEALLDAAARAFGSWTVRAPEPDDDVPGPPIPALDLPALVVVDDPAAPTTTLAWRCPLGGEEPARAVLAGLARTRLFAALRADTGWSYAPWAEVSEDRGTPTLSVSVAVPHARAAAALTAIEHAVDALATGTVPADALARAREAWLWANAPSVAPPAAVLDLAIGPDGVRTAEALRAFPDRVRAVTPADLATALAPCRPNARTALAGPAEALGPALSDRSPTVWTRDEARKRVALD